MIKIESYCVGCKDMGLPCLGNSCPNRATAVTYCDSCDKTVAEYHITGNDYCKDCAEEHLGELFSKLSIYEKAYALDINIYTCE